MLFYRAFYYLLLILMLIGCGPTYIPTRLVAPSVEKQGDSQIDVSAPYQLSGFHALSDSVFIGSNARVEHKTGDPNSGKESTLLGGGFGLGYQQRFKSNKSFKYSVYAGSLIESWDGADYKDYFDEDDVSPSIAFRTMLAVPHAQFTLSYGGRYSNIQLSTRGSYLSFFSSEIGAGLRFEDTFLLETSLQGQISVYDRLSLFAQTSFHFNMTENQDYVEGSQSYHVLPFIIHLGLSYSFGSDGSFDRFSSPQREKKNKKK